MKAYFSLAFLACFILGAPHVEAAEKRLFRFGILTQVNDAEAENSNPASFLDALDDEKLAFIVANGIKSPDEPCTDELYTERRDAFDHARHPLIPSLAADDWTKCVNSSGKPAAVERLNHVRELFFPENFSFGERKISLIRQSISPQFRSYGENVRWRFRNVLFATIHLPANNNNYVSEAGRNSEFEDRAIANRDWLQRLFIFAKRKKLDGIVLFCDGNPLAIPKREDLAGLKADRDGFLVVQRQILKLAAGFPGKILIVHRQASGPRSSASTAHRIRWSRNLGEVGIARSVSTISVVASPTLFVLDQAPDKTRSPSLSQP
jgi:hypothetical protein